MMHALYIVGMTLAVFAASLAGMTVGDTISWRDFKYSPVMSICLLFIFAVLAVVAVTAAGGAATWVCVVIIGLLFGAVLRGT